MKGFYSRLSRRGQVSIPRELRERLGLRPVLGSLFASSTRRFFFSRSQKALSIRFPGVWVGRLSVRSESVSIATNAHASSVLERRKAGSSTYADRVRDLLRSE